MGTNTIQFAMAIKEGLFCGMQRLLRGRIVQKRKMGSGLKMCVLGSKRDKDFGADVLHDKANSQEREDCCNGFWFLRCSRHYCNAQAWCVFGQALIKKCRGYWPHHIPGNKINNYFVEKELEH